MTKIGLEKSGKSRILCEKPREIWVFIERKNVYTHHSTVWETNFLWKISYEKILAFFT